MSAMQDRIHEKYKCDFDHVFESLWKGLIYLSAFIQSLNVITRGRSQDDYNYIADILYPLIEEAKTKFDGMTINAEGLLQQINSDFEQCVVDLKIKNDMLKNIVSHLNELEKELEGAQKCVDNAEHQCRIKREHLSAAENALSNAKRKLEVAKRNQIKTVVAGVATTVASFFASLFVPPLGIAGMAAGISTGIYGVTFLHKTVSTCLNNLKAAQSEVQSSESALERARNPKTEVENKLNMANKKKQQIKTQMEEVKTDKNGLEEYRELIIIFAEEYKNFYHQLCDFHGKYKVLRCETSGGYSLSMLQSPTKMLGASISSLFQCAAINQLCEQHMQAVMKIQLLQIGSVNFETV